MTQQILAAIILCTIAFFSGIAKMGDYVVKRAENKEALTIHGKSYMVVPVNLVPETTQGEAHE